MFCGDCLPDWIKAVQPSIEASGEKVPLRLRSMVGLIPLFAVGIVEQEVIDKLPELWSKFELYRERQSDLVKLVSRWNEGGVKGRRLFSLVRVFRMTRLLQRKIDTVDRNM